MRGEMRFLWSWQEKPVMLAGYPKSHACPAENKPLNIFSHHWEKVKAAGTWMEGRKPEGI
jgi:hypothetical protein